MQSERQERQGERLHAGHTHPENEGFGYRQEPQRPECGIRDALVSQQPPNAQESQTGEDHARPLRSQAQIPKGERDQTNMEEKMMIVKFTRVEDGQWPPGESWFEAFTTHQGGEFDVIVVVSTGQVL